MKAVAATKKYHHGNLRAALIEAGLKVIEEKGVRALTLREIGTRAGVSRMAAYRHFANKADLLFAISEAGFEQFGEALESAKRQAGDSFEERMHAMALAYVRFASEHSAYYQVMFQPEGEHVQRGEAAARGFRILEQTVREGQQSGDVMPGDSVEIARLAWSMVHGISSLNAEPGSKQPGAGARFTRFCSEVLLAGLRPA
jgi:AcrR family transcriptional regulator